MELVEQDILPEGPIRDWVRRAVEADRADAERARTATREGDDTVCDLPHVRSLLIVEGWPDLQPIPGAEIRYKGLGPIQWWNVGTYVTFLTSDEY